MDTILRRTLQEVLTGISDGSLRYLINGKSCSGKSRLAENLLLAIDKLDNLNPFILNGKTFAKFFNLSAINNYKHIKIPIENNKIIIDFSSDKPLIRPFPESDEYKSIFKKHKYIEKNKRFSFEKNVLIIDDCEQVNLNLFYVLDKSLKLIFNPEDLFGGIYVILIGNSKVDTPFENIFSSALYNNNKNLYKFFNILSINDVKTRFSITNPSLEYYNLHSFLLKDRIRNRIGVIEEKDKVFFKSRDVDINRHDLRNEIYFSNDYNEIKNYNINIVNRYDIQKYYVKPTKLFLDKNVSKDKLEYFYKMYERALEPLILFENAKVFFTYDIPELDIKRGQIGYVKSINLKNYEGELSVTVDNMIEIDSELHLKSINIEIESKQKDITPKKVVSVETNLSFKALPIVLGYCVHFKYLTYIPKGNLILTKDTSINVVESCINKILDIGFKNTDLLNYPKLFESKYSEIIKNGIKL